MKRLAILLILSSCAAAPSESRADLEADLVSREALYSVELAVCRKAAQSAFNVLHLQASRVEIDSLQALVESSPIRIWMHRMGPGQTRVIFSAGHANSILQLKAAFEQALRGQTRGAQN
jgi:hypothetical protein